MKISFAEGAWDTKDLVYANSYRFQAVPLFVQEKDCVVNQRSSDAESGFENVSLMSRVSYTARTRISTRCSFENWGAPLIVIADKMAVDENFHFRYGNYLEIVLYENGVNVWRMWYKNGKVTWKKLMSVDFPVTPNEIHTLTAEIYEDHLQITADERKMSLYVPDMYESYHLGIDACEDINRFYELEITHTPVPADASKFRCTVCEHIHEGEEAPVSCPDCNSSAEKFVKEE